MKQWVHLFKTHQIRAGYACGAATAEPGWQHDKIKHDETGVYSASRVNQSYKAFDERGRSSGRFLRLRCFRAPSYVGDHIYQHVTMISLGMLRFLFVRCHCVLRLWFDKWWVLVLWDLARTMFTKQSQGLAKLCKGCLKPGSGCILDSLKASMFDLTWPKSKCWTLDSDCNTSHSRALWFFQESTRHEMRCFPAPLLLDPWLCGRRGSDSNWLVLGFQFILEVWRAQVA